MMKRISPIIIVAPGWSEIEGGHLHSHSLSLPSLYLKALLTSSCKKNSVIISFFMIFYFNLLAYHVPV